MPGTASSGSSVEGLRPEKAASTASAEPISSTGGSAASTAPREPYAQQADLDTPPSDSIRAETQNEQAAAENTVSPPQRPTQPLPDLRQGIPSTFDLEFGQGKARAGATDVTDYKSDAGGGSRRPPNDEDFNRSDFQTSIDRRRAKVFSYGWYGFAFAIVFGGLYLARPYSDASDIPTGIDPADTDGWVPGKMWRRIRSRFGDQMGYYTEPAFPKLLPDVPLDQRAPYTLVLSLEDLLVHSTWDRTHGYRMAKRPGVDYFIRYLSPYYELVLFTSVPVGIADPVIKKLDPFHFIMWPLGREATKYEGGDFVKDLSYLNRDLKKTLIIDTVPGHVKNQPENAIVLPKWSGDVKDPKTNDLVALIPFLEYIATMNIDDVREVIRSFEGKDIPTEFARREAIAREQFHKQYAEQKSKRPKKSLGSMFGSGLGIKPERGMGPNMSEGFAEGKMLSDQIREQGQKQYEALEKQIREEGEKWLKAEAEEQKKLMDESMKEIKQNPLAALANFWGVGPPPPAPASK